jgi:hypothetical protein
LASSGEENGFSLRNWWRNGVACRVTFILALLGLFNVFEPWQPDYIGADYSITQRSGNETVRSYFRGTESKGGGNAFTEGQGWIPFIGFLGTLFVCGKPRRSLGGLRWVPLWAGILIFACTVDAKREQQREREKWLSRFTTRPLVMESPAQQWVILFSLGMIISGACLAPRPKGSPSPVPPS